MQLIGMLDSPYVRRVAISFQLLGLPFEHRSVSVFRGFPEFQQINPVVKAPTFVCDDGEVLMESTLILHYCEALAHPRTLLPSGVQELQHELRLTGLALAACEKSAQIVYERGLRPPEKWHQPWLNRVTGQLLAAYAALEQELARKPLAVQSSTISQAGVSVAVAWHFTRQMLPEIIAAQDFPNLVAFSEAAEVLPEFRAAPYGEATYRHEDQAIARVDSTGRSTRAFGAMNSASSLPPLDLEDLAMSMEWVSSSLAFDNVAYVSRDTGRIFWSPSEDEDLPDDVEDGTRYIAVPTKQDLDLGRKLAIAFTEEFAADDLPAVLGYFRNKGAYAKFKTLLDRRGMLDRWHSYENAATEEALREWAQENGFTPSSAARANDA